MDTKAFWHDVLSKKREALLTYFWDDAIIRWHCSNECFTVSEYVRANCEYPGKWDGEIERMEEMGDTVILAGRVYPAEERASFHVVSFIKLRERKISELDEYWAADGDAPTWRKEMMIGKPIR